MEDTEQLCLAIRASDPNVLVVVSKTSNKNVIVYYACRDDNGNIDKEHPVRVEWIMLEQDPTGHTREPLTFIEQNAFGITDRPFKGAPCFSIPSLYGGAGIIYVHQDEVDKRLAKCLVSFTHSDDSTTKMRIEHVHVNVGRMHMDWSGLNMLTNKPVTVRLTHMGMYSHVLD
jgi:hypothetical protein